MSALRQYFLDPFLFTKVPLADTLDLQAVLGRESLRVLSEFVSERLGKAGISEDADVVVVQIGGHTAGEADLGQRAKYQNPVVAGQQSSDLVGMSFGQ